MKDDNSYDSFGKVISRDGSYNYLYDRYKKDVIKYKEKIKEDISNYNPIDNLDIIIKLHYCFEYNINEFFRSSFMHKTGVQFDGKNRDEIIKQEKELNKVDLLEKISYYIGLPSENYKDITKYITKIKISQNSGRKIKKNIIKFNEYRNIVYHGSELSNRYSIDEGEYKYVYEDFDGEKYEGIKKYFDLYQNCINSLKNNTPDEYKGKIKNIFEK